MQTDNRMQAEDPVPAGTGSIPEGLYYDQKDLWVKLVGGLAVIGMTDYGQKNTGDILYLELLEQGTSLCRGDQCGSIESGKWVGVLNSPLSGIIVEKNRAVELNPRQVNADAYGAGWIYRLAPVNLQELDSLMNARAYGDWIELQESREGEAV